MAELRTKYVCGRLGKTVAVRLLPGTDLMNGLKKTCEDNGIRGGAVLTAIGSLQKVTFQVLAPNEKAKMGAAYTEPQVTPGPIEILGIQGVILETDSGEVVLHLHGTFCDKEGKTFGGHLVPGENPILATLDAIIGEVADVRFGRRYDEETELNMFSPEGP
jgi:predicted DNA-binding protein with PD1-like motif